MATVKNKNVPSDILEPANVQYKNCKFGTYCKFEHDLPKDENKEEIENIKKELEEFKERIIEKEK